MAPWEALPDDPFFSKSPITGMISSIERKMLFWAARDHWAGVGEIVEVGSFAGLSTSYLAEGVIKNARCPYKNRRIHAFDLFQIDDSNAASYLQFLPQLDPGYRGTFLPVFEKNLFPYRDLVVAHPGDTYEVDWSGKPIEVLFIDCAISEHFHEMLFHKFYRSLIPSQGLLIHQDFFFHRSYHLAPMMKKLEAYFEIVDAADTSMVYRCTRPLDDELFRKRLFASSADMIETLNGEIDFFGGTSSAAGGILATSLVYYYMSSGRQEEARQLGASIEKQNQHDVVLRNLQGALSG